MRHHAHTSRRMYLGALTVLVVVVALLVAWLGPKVSGAARGEGEVGHAEVADFVTQAAASCS